MPINDATNHIHILENGRGRNTRLISVKSNGFTANGHPIELNETFGHELRRVLLIGKLCELAS